MALTPSEFEDGFETASIPLQYFETNISFRKKGNIVEVHPPSVIKANSGIPTGTVTHNTPSTLIPVGFRPLTTVMLYPQSTGSWKVSMQLYPDGTITGYNYSSASPSTRQSNFLNEAMYFASSS